MIRPTLLVFLALQLLACSGGSGSGSPSGDTVVVTPPPTPPIVQNTPNILLIISDDQGIDASAQYPNSMDVPLTPTVDALALSGIVYDNVWATPSCTTTRATLLTGKYGVNSGITRTPGTLSTDQETIQAYLSLYPETASYESAVFGKWHIGDDATHPLSVGIEHFAGNLYNLDDYYAWDLVTNGISSAQNEYHTSVITSLAIDWIGQQSTPWFAWVAYSAPHSPFHLPPANLHSRSLSGTAADITANRREYLLAALEAMDTEIGRLLDSLPSDVRDNTLVVYVGDNGTGATVVDTLVFPQSHSKLSMYEGGLRVPLVVSGAGVTRAGERDDALITTTDFFATIASVAGSSVSAIYDSQSFVDSFSSADFVGRDMMYSAFHSPDLDGWAVRKGPYKLIETVANGQELYDVDSDLAEINNLLPGNASIEAARTELEQFALAIEDPGSGSGGGGSGQTVDITDAILTDKNASCGNYVDAYRSDVTDIGNNVDFVGDLIIEVVGNKCVFNSNAIPNHDFNDVDGFPNDVSAQNDVYEIPATPLFAASNTALSLTYDNAILLNGVKVDLLAAACFGVGDGKIGCNNINQPWRYDPMHGPNGFRVDTHNAHTQPDGTYHYHGPPNALYFADTPVESPVVGFAADGFPIYGSYFDDGGLIRKATSSYRLRDGSRPSGAGEPAGSYDGTFRDDYEYVDDFGDLDDCNGMAINGTYAYYVTGEYPYIVGCFKGSPDATFQK
jgi:arylsulfatase A-like enzyme